MENMAKIVIATGSIVGLAYTTEFFTAWYSGSFFERYIFINRAFGDYWWAYFSMFFCNVVTPQLFWSKKIRTNMTITFILSIFVNIGMWFERFVIIVTSLHHDFVPARWANYAPTFVEVGIFIGSFGIFFTCFLLFTKFAPVVNMFEVKTLLRELKRPAGIPAVPKDEVPVHH